LGWKNKQGARRKAQGARRRAQGARLKVRTPLRYEASLGMVKVMQKASFKFKLIER
jgi:chromosome condensin MukBEF MukE localization factor